MPRTYSPIDKIRAELAWVNETPQIQTSAVAGTFDAVKKLETSPAGYSASVATKFWTFRWVYYCAPGREC